jgi:asparagine synthase (glutamine-hydrolysing)
MFYSIENRSPYLDRDLLEFSSTIPSSYLIENGYQKKILREVTSNMLNDKIRLDRRKKGFNASINSLLNLDNPEIIDYIFNEKTELAEFINLKKVKKDLDMKFIPNHLSKFIFSLLGTKIFLENN